MAEDRQHPDIVTIVKKSHKKNKREFIAQYDDYWRHQQNRKAAEQQGQKLRSPFQTTKKMGGAV